MHRAILDEYFRMKGLRRPNQANRGNSVQSSISKGVDQSLAGAPVQSVTEKPVSSVALLGVDYPGLRPAMSVAEGDRVHVGQVLFTDRMHPRIAFVAPLSGRIASIDFRRRRRLSALVIRRDPDEPVKVLADAPIDVTSATALRDALLSRGLWPAFRTRPFGHIPVPDAVPRAIFVTATDSEPLAPDPRVVLASRNKKFRLGTDLLTLLTDGPVYVCQPPGPPLADETGRIRIARFDGPHPAGLAGTHIHVLHPVSPGGEIWTIDCQDVAAIGHLAETGNFDPARIIALAGPRAAHPRLIRTISGASIRDLTLGEEVDGQSVRFISGSRLSGRDSAWLGRNHRQVTMIDAPAAHPRRRWSPAFWGRVRSVPRPIIPTSALERTLPAGFLPVPLVRALSVGDVEAAARLGALELIEEDMALLSALCTSGADYGALLRQTLDTLAEAA